MKKSIFASYILTTLMLSSVMFTLVFSTFMISPVGAQDTTIGVETAEIVSDSTFTVEIWIRGVVDLADFEFMLGYDTAVLMATSVEYGGIFGDTYFELGSGINDIEGWVGYGCMEMFGELGFTGDGIAATVTFTVDSYGSSNLDLYETELRDSQANLISHTVTDGAFANVDVSVDPRFIWDPALGVGATFDVDVVVKDVTDLYGFDFKLGYDTSVLTATAWSFAGNIFEPGYFVWKQEVNDDLGRVWLAVTQMLGETEGVSGSGLLATITFTVDDIGASDLDLYETELRDPGGDLLPMCFVQDGYFARASISSGHDVAVINITAFPTSVPQGEPIYINVTVENQGTFTETFDVNVSGRHWGTGTVIPIGTETVLDLLPGVSKIVNFVWDTTGAPLGTYDLIAEAILPEDDDPEDNIFIAPGIIGGICAPYHKPQTNLLVYLVQIAAMMLIMAVLGTAGMGLLKILGSPRLRWPMRWLKSKP